MKIYELTDTEHGVTRRYTEQELFDVYGHDTVNAIKQGRVYNMIITDRGDTGFNLDPYAYADMPLDPDAYVDEQLREY